VRSIDLSLHLAVNSLNKAGTSGTGRPSLEDVRQYWSSHLNLTQFLRGQEAEREIGNRKFFDAVRASLRRFPYKKALLDFIWANRSGPKLLEVGCGLGADLVELARRGFEVTGIDLSSRAAELAEQHLRFLNLRGNAGPANAESLPFSDNEFDEIYSSGVFQHTPNPQKAIDEAIRVLREGGHMTVVLYHRRSWFWLLSRVGKVNVEFQEEEAPIVEAYTRSELRQMFARLENLTIRMEHFRPSPTRRGGATAALYNKLLVPLARCMPAPLLRPFGFHAVIRGTKPAP
jgi:ubiquinone/menaquinone biosynthesis C-methylase UbiE